MDSIILLSVKVIGWLTILWIGIYLCFRAAWWTYREVKGWPRVFAAMREYERNHKDEGHFTE